MPRRWAGLASTVPLALSIACGADVTAATERRYVAELLGANERPARSSGATGIATIDIAGSVASYTVVAEGLTGPPTVVHLAIGGPDADVGQPIAALALASPAMSSGTIATGRIDLARAITFNNTTISGDSLRVLLTRGGAFVNVHTAVYPGGEIRGQIAPAPAANDVRR